MFKKTHLSAAMSRAWAAEGLPIGDPFGGPAYGEKAMPVVAVAAAIYAGGTIAAAAAGAGIIATLGVAGTIAAVGAVAAGVGVVTGNKTLTKIGGVMALVGGIGALADSAGMFGEVGAIDKAFGVSPGADGTFGSLSKGSDALMGKLTGAPSQAGDGGLIGAQGAAPTTPISQPNSAMNTGVNALDAATESQAGTSTLQGAAQAPTQQAGAAAQTASQPGGQSLIPSGSGPSVSSPVTKAVSTDNLSLFQQMKTSGINSPNIITGPQQSSGMFGNLMLWAKDNPIPAMMGMQSISGLGSALMGGDAAESAANAQNTQTQALKNQMAGGPSLAGNPQWGLIQSRITNQGNK